MKLNQMRCNGYLPVLVDHHLFLPSPLPSFLLPASLLVFPHSLIGCGLASPVPAHLSTMDGIYKLYSTSLHTYKAMHTVTCPPPSPFSHTSHSHIPPPPSPFSHTPTHSHPPTFTPTHLAMAMKQAETHTYTSN